MKKNKKILLITLISVIGGLNNVMAQENKTEMEKKKVTAGRDAWDDFAPKFAEMNDDILFGEIWSREKQLSSRDRSLITVSALFGSGVLDRSFKAHLQKARENGITKEEITEVITHLAFYAGWPKAWAALYLAKEVYGEDSDQGASREVLFGRGEPNVAYNKYFVGQSYLAPMVIPTRENPVQVANVTFEPGCRNNWHTHSVEQILLVTEGRGWYQEEGKEARSLFPGDIVVIQPNVKHWHGAAANGWFTHISISADGISGTTAWLETVTDQEYKLINQ